MKRPTILVFPIAAKLLLCASGIPIHQNHGNGVVTRSVPSSLFPIDSALLKRSDTHDQGQTSQPFAFSSILNPVPNSSNSPFIQTSTHGAPPNVPGHGGGQQPQSIHHLINPKYANPTSSAPANIAAEPAPDDPDRLPEHIPDELYGTAANEVATKLRGSGILPVDTVINNMILMKVLFKQELETKRNQPDTTLRYWRPEMEAFANEPIVSRSDRVQWWKTMLCLQMEALAKLYDGTEEQKTRDASWIDDFQLSTTRLAQGRHTKPPNDVLSIMVSSLLDGNLSQLHTGTTYSQLITMAEGLEKKWQFDNCINNALVLRRKAIQLRLMTTIGMSTKEFGKKKKELRDIVTNSSHLNKVRAEMVILSLQSFIEEHKIQLRLEA